MNRLPTPPEDAPFLVRSETSAPQLVPQAATPELAAPLRDDRTSAWPWLLGAALLSMVVTGLITWLVYRTPPAPRRTPAVQQEEPTVVVAVESYFTPGPVAAPKPATRPKARVRRAPVETVVVDARYGLLHGTLKLSDGSDPGGIASTLYKMDAPYQEPLRLTGWSLDLELPTGQWHLIATAPGHAMKTHSFEMKPGAPTHWGPLVLEPEHLFTVHIPGDSKQVRAGDRWNGLQFIQQNEELIMLGTQCVCVMRSEGEPESNARRCWVAMLIGERYLVRAQPDEPWFSIELTARDEPQAPRRPLIPRRAVSQVEPVAP